MVKDGHELPLEKIRIREAGHPVPDERGVAGTLELLNLLASAGERDLVICLISGGGSALLIAPSEGIRLADKQAVTKDLLACGATIHEINAIRKHLSRAKGGRLARAAHPAAVLSLILSDVVGDDLDVIGSGPTVPDRSRFQDALEILQRYAIWDRTPACVRERLSRGAQGVLPETPKPGDPLRLNPDGSAPSDNPFHAAGGAMGGEVGENIQKIFSYGHRNSFGMTVDPVSGAVWLQENGDDTFGELNRLEPGMNAGWIQIAGPVSRIAQFKEIETTFGARALQQLRWPPTNIADSPEEALSRLFMLPGAKYVDPAFSWKWEVAPGGMGFVESKALGPQFENDLFMGAATPVLQGGYLVHFNLKGKTIRGL